MDKDIGIIGGDLRLSKLAMLFAKDNYKVYTYAIEESVFEEKVIDKIKKCNNIEEVANNTKIIISSVPLSREGNTVFSPLSKETVYIDELFGEIKGKTFIAGDIKDYTYDIARKNNIEIIDIFRREELAMLNAIPTAEGAIQIAMEESEITLHDSNCLILGYGRIGKILAKMLKGIGANVYCEARKSSDLALIKAYAYQKVELEKVDNEIKKYDFIFNTVPYLLLHAERLNKIKKEAVIIDLASKPGGTDFEEAKKLGIKAILALRITWKGGANNFSKVHTRNNIHDFRQVKGNRFKWRV